MKNQSMTGAWLTGLGCFAILLCARAAGASGVSISSPASGATVSGRINIVAAAGSGVVWVNINIDGDFYASSPPFSFSWETTEVGNGPHTITAYAYNSSGTNVGTASRNVTVDNSASGGRSYYVASGGRDSNSGTSPSSAWLTLNRVNSANLQPGDTVFFQSGQMWRGTLEPPRGGIPGAPISFAAFGSGNRPVISGSDIVGGWRWYSGNIYRATEADAPQNVYVDGGPGWGLTRVWSVGAIAAGTWYWDSGAKLLYVRLADSSNVVNHTIEAATRVYGFYVNSGTCDDYSYITINGLAFRRTGGFGIYFHCYGGSSPLAGVIIQNNTIDQTGTGKVDRGQYYNGIFFLQEPEYLNAAPQILNNFTSYTGGHGNGINLQGANNAMIRNNNVSEWNHNGIDIKDADGVYVENNISQDRMSGGSAYYAEHSSVNYERNFAYNASNGIQVSVGSRANVYNNSIYDCPTAIYFGPNAQSVVVQNNAISGSSTSFGTDGNPDFTEDYNDLGAGAWLQVGSTRYTFSQWHAMGNHVHDIAANPMWANPPQSMNLLDGSACINRGTDVGLPYEGSAPDLGAIESPY